MSITKLAQKKVIQRFLIGAAILGSAAYATVAEAGPIVGTFTANTLPGNDDGSTGLVNLGFSFNFFGTTYTQAYVNNNGNITFGSPLSTFTPFGLTSALGIPIIAPFFADIDTRPAGSGPTQYATGTYAGHGAFGVEWVHVGYFSQHTDKFNSAELILVDRSDTGAGNADFYFNYGDIAWETGDASGGSNGLGGSCAAAGFSNGTGASGTNFEIDGSHVCGAFLNGGPKQLVTATNDFVPGQFLFQVRNGVVTAPPTGIPEPGTLSLFGFGLLSFAGWARSRRAKA